MACTFMLFFRVYSESDPRPLSSPRNLCSLCVSALSFSFLSHSTFQRSNFPTCERSSYNPFRINTYKSVTKQTTLTLFRINTYEKHRGEGASTFQSSSPISYRLSPLCSYSCALFCVHQKLNSFIFKRFRTLLPKHRGSRISNKKLFQNPNFLRIHISQMKGKRRSLSDRGTK
jgi:hypothetical protein